MATCRTCQGCGSCPIRFMQACASCRGTGRIDNRILCSSGCCRECDVCAGRPGTPVLCDGCLKRRAECAERNRGLRIEIEHMADRKVRAWWQSLPRSLQQEWLSIEWEWKTTNEANSGAADREECNDEKAIKHVSMDWIEEHGGHRAWWSVMHVASD